MWSGSSQKLGLQINNNGNRSSCSPNCYKYVATAMGMANLLCICGRQIFWTPVTKKHNSTLGIDFLAHLLSRSESFLLLLSTTTMVFKGLMPTNVSFLGHLSPGTMGMGFLKGL